MRSPYLLLPLALLLIFQLASTASPTVPPLTGTWTNPSVIQNVSSYCCIPTSIKIERESAAVSIATFKYNENNSKCFTLFNSSNNGTMTLYLDKTGKGYYSETTQMGNLVYNFKQDLNITTLWVFVASSYYVNYCNYSMCREVAPSKDYSMIFAIGVVFLFFIGYFAFENYQKKKASSIIQQNLAQDGFNYNPAPQNGYVSLG